MNALAQIKSRMHHNAYVAKTRGNAGFYEEIIAADRSYWPRRLIYLARCALMRTASSTLVMDQPWHSSSLLTMMTPLNLVLSCSHRVSVTWR